MRQNLPNKMDGKVCIMIGEEEINSLCSNLRRKTFSLSNHLGAIIKQLMKNLLNLVGDKLKGNKVRHKILAVPGGAIKRKILVIIEQRHQLGELL